jgi:hypothetical protein
MHLFELAPSAEASIVALFFWLNYGTSSGQIFPPTSLEM